VTWVNKHSSKAEEQAIPCLRCGVCCTKYQARLEITEARYIAGKLGFGWDEWLDLYTDKRWPGTDSFLLSHCNGRCIFLEQTEVDNVTLCRIQSIKPLSCREWTPGLHQRDCQEGLIKQGK